MLNQAELDEVRARLSIRIMGSRLTFPFNGMTLRGEQHPSEVQVCTLLVEHIDAQAAALAAERALADELAAELDASLFVGLIEAGTCWNCRSKQGKPHHLNCPPAQALARHRAARQGG